MNIFDVYIGKPGYLWELENWPITNLFVITVASNSDVVIYPIGCQFEDG